MTCVEEMREQGYEVHHAFVLIDRTEGDSTEELARIGVTLIPLMRIGDGDLEGIVERARRGRAM